MKRILRREAAAHFVAQLLADRFKHQSPTYQWTAADLQVLQCYELSASTTAEAALITTINDLAAKGRRKGVKPLR
eukprot:6106021-Amphidinium_carterae.2